MRVGCVGIRIGGLRSPARGHNGSVFRCIRKREKTEGAKKKNGPPSAAGRVRPKNRCSAHLQGAKKMSLFTAAVCEMQSPQWCPSLAGELARRVSGEQARRLKEAEGGVTCLFSWKPLPP